MFVIFQQLASCDQFYQWRTWKRIVGIDGETDSFVSGDNDTSYFKMCVTEQWSLTIKSTQRTYFLRL